MCPRAGFWDKTGTAEFPQLFSLLLLRFVESGWIWKLIVVVVRSLETDAFFFARYEEREESGPYTLVRGRIDWTLSNFYRPSRQGLCCDESPHCYCLRMRCLVFAFLSSREMSNILLCAVLNESSIYISGNVPHCYSPLSCMWNMSINKLALALFCSKILLFFVPLFLLLKTLIYFEFWQISTRWFIAKSTNYSTSLSIQYQINRIFIYLSSQYIMEELRQVGPNMMVWFLSNYLN